MKRENLVFGEKLRYLRVSQSKTQQRVADDLCISRGTLSNYETGARVPDISTLKTLANYFGVDANFFIDTTKIRAVFKEDDNHTLFLMKEKEKPKVPKRKMSPSSLIALNHFNLGSKALRSEKNERK